MLDKYLKQKLKRVFDLALQIDGAQVSYTPSAETIQVFKLGRFEGYVFSYTGYYSDWCKPENPESLYSLIKNLTDHIKNQK